MSDTGTVNLTKSWSAVGEKHPVPKSSDTTHLLPFRERSATQFTIVLCLRQMSAQPKCVPNGTMHSEKSLRLAG